MAVLLLACFLVKSGVQHRPPPISLTGAKAPARQLHGPKGPWLHMGYTELKLRGYKFRLRRGLGRGFALADDFFQLGSIELHHAATAQRDRARFFQVSERAAAHIANRADARGQI